MIASRVTSMSGMFGGCISLSTLNLSVDISSVRSLRFMQKQSHTIGRTNHKDCEVTIDCRLRQQTYDPHIK